MAVKRPGFVPDIQANLNATKQSGLFRNVKEDETLVVRFFPPASEDGLLFRKARNHYKIKDDNNKPIALACLEEHGTEDTGYECWLCKLVLALGKGDTTEKEFGKQLRANDSHYAQVLEANKKDDGSFNYAGPFLLRLPKTAASSVNKIMGNQHMMGEPYFCDVDAGQNLMITRTGTGFNTEYHVDRSSSQTSLDDIFPAWAEKFFDDILGTVNLNIIDPSLQKKYAQLTFGDKLDWGMLEAECGL